VDDDLDDLELVDLVLTSQGAFVATANGAAAGLMALNHRRFDLLVSDIAMPCEDGYSLIAKVRQHDPPGIRMPAVALTAYARAEDRLRALEAGFQQHVPKPISPEELIAVVASMTGRSPRTPATAKAGEF